MQETLMTSPRAHLQPYLKCIGATDKQWQIIIVILNSITTIRVQNAIFCRNSGVFFGRIKTRVSAKMGFSSWVGLVGLNRSLIDQDWDG